MCGGCRGKRLSNKVVVIFCLYINIHPMCILPLSLATQLLCRYYATLMRCLWYKRCVGCFRTYHHNFRTKTKADPPSAFISPGSGEHLQHTWELSHRQNNNVHGLIISQRPATSIIMLNRLTAGSFTWHVLAHTAYLFAYSLARCWCFDETTHDVFRLVHF